MGRWNSEMLWKFLSHWFNFLNEIGHKVNWGWAWEGKQYRLEKREGMKSRRREKEVGFLGSTNGSLEAHGDEIQVKLVSVVVFLASHRQMHGCCCGGDEELVWIRTVVLPASTTKGEKSWGVEGVWEGVIVMTGQRFKLGKNGREWICRLKNCWT